jgi:hypothetical protein
MESNSKYCTNHRYKNYETPLTTYFVLSPSLLPVFTGLLFLFKNFIVMKFPFVVTYRATRIVGVRSDVLERHLLTANTYPSSVA